MSAASNITTHPHTSLYPHSQATKMSAYYRVHSNIYDITRWTFLFGRRCILDWLPYSKMERFTLLEVGCGTGYNLKYLSNKFSKAKLFGVDASADMLKVANQKLPTTFNTPVLTHGLYDKNYIAKEAIKPNVILFSYCLTMVNPNWDALILQAKTDLADKGIIAVVDFHSSPSALFKSWMGKNHVRMDSHLLPFLETHFTTVKCEVRKAYFGLWEYVLYVGER